MLFAAGAGGDPERHRPLLEHLASHGCHVIAPAFDRLHPRDATTAELVARPTGLAEAVAERAAPDTPIAAVGHSIGAWAALCLAGARPHDRDGSVIPVPREPRVDSLVLYAPAAGWFRAPGALAAVSARMLVFAGERDQITPVEDVSCLTAAPVDVDLRVVPGAGHFSFMDVLPPGVDDHLGAERDVLLTRLAADTLRFLGGDAETDTDG